MPQKHIFPNDMSFKNHYVHQRVKRTESNDYQASPFTINRQPNAATEHAVDRKLDSKAILEQSAIQKEPPASLQQQAFLNKLQAPTHGANSSAKTCNQKLMMNCSPYNVNDTIRKNPSKPNRVSKKERKRRQLDRGESEHDDLTSHVQEGHDHSVPTALIKLHEQPLRDQLIESMRMENKSCSGTRDKDPQKRTYNLSQMSTQKGVQHKQQSMRYDQQPKAKAIITKKSDARKESGSQVVKKLLAGGLLQNAKSKNQSQQHMFPPIEDQKKKQQIEQLMKQNGEAEFYSRYSHKNMLSTNQNQQSRENLIRKVVHEEERKIQKHRIFSSNLHMGSTNIRLSKSNTYLTKLTYQTSSTGPMQGKFGNKIKIKNNQHYINTSSRNEIGKPGTEAVKAASSNDHEEEGQREAEQVHIDRVMLVDDSNPSLRKSRTEHHSGDEDLDREPESSSDSSGILSSRKQTIPDLGTGIAPQSPAQKSEEKPEKSLTFSAIAEEGDPAAKNSKPKQSLASFISCNNQSKKLQKTPKLIIEMKKQIIDTQAGAGNAYKKKKKAQQQSLNNLSTEFKDSYCLHERAMQNRPQRTDKSRVKKAPEQPGKAQPNPRDLQLKFGNLRSKGAKQESQLARCKSTDRSQNVQRESKELVHGTEESKVSQLPIEKIDEMIESKR